MFKNWNRKFRCCIFNNSSGLSIRMHSSISDIKKKHTLPSRYKNADQSIWNESTALKLKYTCIDLAQGFPNYLPNVSAVKILTDVANSGENTLHQYSRSSGRPRLVNAVGALNSRTLNREINPLTEVLITCGAYEALHSSIVGNVEVGDEVIIIEPSFDCYQPMVLVSGGIVKYIPLRKGKCTALSTESSADWKLDEQELRDLFNEKTKMIIINTPMNPTGKVFSQDELNLIAELCIKHDAICISDEVYEWMVYEPATHIKIATLPGMWERTVTIGSAGKALCVTGWKCGWACAPAALIENARVVHLLNVDSTITPIQEAVAQCLEIELKRFDSEDCLFKVTAKMLKAKRDYFVKLLSEAGFRPIVPDGGFFIVADWTSLKNKIDLSTEEGLHEDYKLMKWMAKNIGLLAIPPTTFYSDDHKYIAENLIRFCFFKTDEVLKAGADCLNKLKS